MNEGMNPETMAARVRDMLVQSETKNEINRGPLSGIERQVARFIDGTTILSKAMNKLLSMFGPTFHTSDQRESFGIWLYSLQGMQFGVENPEIARQLLAEINRSNDGSGKPTDLGRTVELQTKTMRALWDILGDDSPVAAPDVPASFFDALPEGFNL